MRNLSSSTGSVSYGSSSGEDRGSPVPFAGEGYQNIIEQANTISIIKLFRMYGLRLDENNRKTTCPFKNHKGGRETTASFYFYPETNTYFCYGCRQGSKPTDFISNMDRCTKVRAAQKILENFNSDLDQDSVIDIENFSERLEIMIEYSNAVRNFRINFPGEKEFSFIEENCKLYDTMNKKYDLSNEALKAVTIQLIDAINNYRP